MQEGHCLFACGVHSQKEWGHPQIPTILANMPFSSTPEADTARRTIGLDRHEVETQHQRAMGQDGCAQRTGD